ITLWRTDSPPSPAAFQRTGASSDSSSRSIETTRTPATPVAGRIPSPMTASGSRGTPSMRASEGPFRSASTAPTRWPRLASAAATFAVTALLPTPPLPLATAITQPMPERRSSSRLRCAATCSGTPSPPPWPSSWYVRMRRMSAPAPRCELCAGRVQRDQRVDRADVARLDQPFRLRLARVRTERADAVRIELEDVRCDLDAVAEPHAQRAVDPDGQLANPALHDRVHSFSSTGYEDPAGKVRPRRGGRHGGGHAGCGRLRRGDAASQLRASTCGADVPRP